MLEDFIKDPAAVERRRTGLFGVHLESFIASVSELGYRRPTVKHRLRVLHDFERWLKRRKLALVNLNQQVANKFLESRRHKGHLRKGDARGIHHFLEHLCEKGAIPSAGPAVDESPLKSIQRRYEEYLKNERGLSPVTIARYCVIARHFIVERFGERAIRLRELVPDDISAFLLRNARSGSPGSAKLMVTALRSFFRFLFRYRETDNELATAVPTVAAWRLAEVPKYLEADEVERVIQACDRSKSVGRRDFAIILLLARLGLRAGEVVALDLDDIDWRSGVLTVRGKGRYHDRLPLPPDAGEAIVAYLQQDRPRCTTRRVFIRNKAPRRGFGNPSSISTIVSRALKRAGLQPDLKGAHILRHSLATGMLRRGASMAEIGQILRHRAASTTEIYAKVDLKGLRALALPWPTKGGER